MSSRRPLRPKCPPQDAAHTLLAWLHWCKVNGTGLPEHIVLIFKKHFLALVSFPQNYSFQKIIMIILAGAKVHHEGPYISKKEQKYSKEGLLQTASALQLQCLSVFYISQLTIRARTKTETAILPGNESYWVLLLSRHSWIALWCIVWECIHLGLQVCAP